jgi:hypothetical protein
MDLHFFFSDPGLHLINITACFEGNVQEMLNFFRGILLRLGTRIGGPLDQAYADMLRDFSCFLIEHFFLFQINTPRIVVKYSWSLSY